MTNLEASVLIITQFGTLVVAGLAAWKATRADRNTEKNNRIAERIEINIDGRLSELLEKHGDLQRALGVTEGEQLQRERESGGGEGAAREQDRPAAQE